MLYPSLQSTKVTRIDQTLSAITTASIYFLYDRLVTNKRINNTPKIDIEWNNTSYSLLYDSHV